MNQETLRIGNLKLDSPFLLAPLAGITDAPQRRICKRQGASLVYTEMVSGKGLYYKDKNTESLLRIYEDEKPVAFQIFGSEPDIIAYTAKELVNRNNAILDINMGCPVPKIVKNGEGSALLKNLDLIYDLISVAVKHAKKPVTAKIRLGWDGKSIVAVEAAKAIELAGGSAVAVHGRTREQYYSGKADWNSIGEVKRAVKIPVIGNGDVFSGEDANRMLQETGCDFVMIARGALGNPWIFRDAIALWRGHEKPEAPSKKEKLTMLMEHFEAVIEEKGEYAGIREMRKQVGWYLKGMHGSARFRNEINNMTSADEIRNILTSLL